MPCQTEAEAKISATIACRFDPFEDSLVATTLRLLAEAALGRRWGHRGSTTRGPMTCHSRKTGPSSSGTNRGTILAEREEETRPVSVFAFDYVRVKGVSGQSSLIRHPQQRSGTANVDTLHQIPKPLQPSSS